MGLVKDVAGGVFLVWPVVVCAKVKASARVCSVSSVLDHDGIALVRDAMVQAAWSVNTATEQHMWNSLIKSAN